MSQCKKKYSFRKCTDYTAGEEKVSKCRVKTGESCLLIFRELVEISLFAFLHPLAATDYSFRALLILASLVDDCCDTIHRIVFKKSKLFHQEIGY